MHIKVVEEFGSILEGPVEVELGLIQRIIEQGSRSSFRVSPFISLKNVTCLNSFQLKIFNDELQKISGVHATERESLKAIFYLIDQAIINRAFLLFDREC